MKHIFLGILTPLLLLTVSLLPSKQVDARSGQFAPNLSALEVISEVNAFRASKNLPPYQVDSTLMTVAQSHADYIAGTGVITQFSADGKHPYQRAIAAGYAVAGELKFGGNFAESLGSGADLTPVEVVDLWEKDADDLKNLFSSNMEDIGVGVTTSKGITYYVMDVGAAVPEGAFTPTPTLGTPSALVAVNTPQEDGTIQHEVQKDEGLWNIALAYNTTVEEIKRLNGLATDEIFIGQKLIVHRPEVQTATPVVIATATFGIPTSTATRPVTPTVTSTSTPLPAPPTTRQSGGIVVGAIVGFALLAAAVGSWLGRTKPVKSEP